MKPTRPSGDLRFLKNGKKSVWASSTLLAVLVGEVGEQDAEADLEEEFFEAGETLAAARAAAGGELEPVVGHPDRRRARRTQISAICTWKLRRSASSSVEITIERDDERCRPWSACRFLLFIISSSSA